jgi:hypothetical protein
MLIITKNKIKIFGVQFTTGNHSEEDSLYLLFLRVLETFNFRDAVSYAKVPDVNLYTLFTGL